MRRFVNNDFKVKNDMATWKVSPDIDGVLVSWTNPGEIYFPKNTGTTDIEYTITYIDDNGCSGQTKYAVPSGSACQPCNDPRLWITPTDTTTNVGATDCLSYDYNYLEVQRCHVADSDIGKTLSATGYFTANGTCPSFGPEKVVVYRDFSSVNVPFCSISKDGFNFRESLTSSELKVSGGDLYIEISGVLKIRIKGETNKNGDSFWEFTPYSEINDYYRIQITVGNIGVYTKINGEDVELDHTTGSIHEFSIDIVF